MIGSIRAMGIDRIIGMDIRKRVEREAAESRKNVRVGDVVMRYWRAEIAEDEKKKIGLVIYVHPRGYYHTVRFRLDSGVFVHEAFSGVKV